MAHKNKIEKYLVDKTCQNLPCLLVWLKSYLERDAISAGPEKGFLTANVGVLTHS